MLRGDDEWRRAEERTVKDAATFSEAYEQYRTRSVAQMAQITMQVKHGWKTSHN